MRVLMLSILIGAALGGAANAQTPVSSPSATLPATLPVMPMPAPTRSPRPHASARPMPIMTFTNPAAKHGVSSANGGSCIRRNAVAAQQRINPITGQPQAGTLVSVPITSGSGSIARATNHQQQIDACAHTH